MAGRPPKEKLDYYSMDVGWIYDTKIRRLVRKTGYAGLGLYSYILSETYKEGYALRYDENFLFSAADFGGIEETEVIRILEIMEAVGLIEEIQTAEGPYLSSKGIQRRYQFIRQSLKRKAEFFPNDELWLLKDEHNSIMTEKIGAKLNYDGKNRCEIELCATETETERKQKKERKKETERKQKAETETTAFDSDVLQTSFSDYLIMRLKKEGVEVRKNTLQWINEAIEMYDPRSIEEALETAINREDTRSVVGLAKTILEGWTQGKGSPEWVKKEEAEHQAKKREQLKPSGYSGILKRI